MEKVRIGNDLGVNFSVYRNGEPESFDGASNIVTKLVNEAYNKLITHTYTIAGNIVQFDIDALQLTQCGKCRLFISYTKGGDYTVDSPAFELVNYTDQTGGTEIIGVEIVSINISGDIGINRDGLSAYEVWESYPGNEGKTIEQYFTWLRENPTKIDLDGLNSNIDKLHFNPDTLVQLTSIGDVRYSTESRTLEVKVSDAVYIQLGQEMQTRVKNNAGVQINNGQMVYIDSAAEANPLAKIASTANADIAQRTFGMATENIAFNGFGAITTEGLVRDVNTAAFTEGDMLWLGVNGAVTNIEPVAPTPKISVGMVLRSNVANGVIYVKIRAISRNQKLSDVYAPTLAGGDILRWNSTTLRFETFNVTTALAGKADLIGGKIPTSQLPSYVDDVLEYTNLSAFPATGETGKIYLTLDTNLTYRWSGTAYVEISKSLALGETSSTAYRGDRGKTAYDHSQATGNVHGTTASQIPNTPAGTIAATTVQGAINELAGDIAQVETNLNNKTVYNVNVALNNLYGYYTFEMAFAAIPIVDRRVGMLITFRSSGTTVEFAQYLSGNVGDSYFLLKLNWKCWSEAINDNIIKIQDLYAVLSDKSEKIYSDYDYTNDLSIYTSYLTNDATSPTTISLSPQHYNQTYAGVKIKCKAGDAFKIYGYGGSARVRLWAFADIDGNLLDIAGAEIRKIEEDLNTNTLGPIVKIAPENSKYFFFNPQVTTGVCKCIKLTTYEKPIFEPIKMVNFGDSITDGTTSFFTNAEETTTASNTIRKDSYAYFMSKIMGISSYNAGIGGMGYLCNSTNMSKPYNLKTLIDKMTTVGDPLYVNLSTYDIATVALGINDYKGSYDIGSITDDINSGLSVISNMRYFVEKIISINPYIKIFIITPMNARGYGYTLGDYSTNYALGYQNNDGKTLQDFFNEIVTVCEYYGIQYIDQTHRSIVNRNNIIKTLPDGVHPTLQTQKCIAKELAAKITYMI